MRYLIIAILLLFSVVAYAEIEVIAPLKIKNDAKAVVADIVHIGITATDSCIDIDGDGVIDVRRLMNSWTSGQNDGLFLKYYATGDSLGWTSAGGSIKWRDSSYVYLDTANILGGNTEIKAWLDTTAVRVPIADSTHGGATRATTSAVADSANGGSIRSETCKIADSCDGGAARAEVSDSTNSPFRAAVHDSLDANWSTFTAQNNPSAEIGDSLEGYIINSGNDTTSGTLTSLLDLEADRYFYVDADSNVDMSYIYFHGKQGSFGFYAPTAGNQQGFHFSHDLHLGGHEIKTVKHPSHDSSAVNRGYMQGIIEDSLDGYSITSVVQDIAHDTLWAHLQYEVIPLIFAHGHPGKPGDNDTTSLECFDYDSLGAYIFKMTFGAADQVDTVMLSATLPYKCTRGDSLIYKYATSSATAATIKIDAIKVSVEGISQTDFATDRSSTATAYVRESLAADGDYNEKEQVTVRFIVAGDSGEWLKIYSAFLVVSR